MERSVNAGGLGAARVTLGHAAGCGETSSGDGLFGRIFGYGVVDSFGWAELGYGCCHQLLAGADGAGGVWIAG